MAIGLVTGQQPMGVGWHVVPASIYAEYFLNRALTRTGLGDNYLTGSGKGRENFAMVIAQAEPFEVSSSRSAGHAWVGYYLIIGGIRPFSYHTIRVFVRTLTRDPGQRPNKHAAE